MEFNFLNILISLMISDDKLYRKIKKIFKQLYFLGDAWNLSENFFKIE
jgi:archaellum biogenesis protein FlaJ (TadC family)